MEEPLPAGGSCLLGALNLSEFVDTDTTIFNYAKFCSAVDIAVRALNNVLDEGLPLHPLQEQRDSVRDWRQIGLGVMGIADMLIKMQARYDSPIAINICDKIADTMAKQAIKTSALLAKEKGSYPKYSKTVMDSEFYKRHATQELNDLVSKYGLRNSQLLTIAPTGSIATMLGISGGIEPMFAYTYMRKTESLHGHDQYYEVYTNIVKWYMDNNNITSTKDLPNWFVNSVSIDPFQRVKMQGAWQKHIDASISSTINLPEETSIDTVRELYMSAWENGLKGMTVFRAGCKRLAILTANPDKKENDKKDEETNSTNFTKGDSSESELTTLPRGAIVECSDNLLGLKKKLVTGCGSLHVTAFFDEETGALQEVYLNKGSTGGCVSAETEFFNGTTWKPIKDYVEGEYVLQYNEDGSANLVRPFNYIVNDNVPTLKEFSNKYFSMILSEDHRMYLYKNYRHFQNGRDSKLTNEIITVADYLAQKKERHLPTTFTYEGSGIPLTDEQIKLCVAFYADGTIDNKNTQYCSIVISKERKKERLVSLLKENNVDYKIFDFLSTHDKNYLTYKFHANQNTIFDQYLLDKQFTAKWYNCNKHQQKLILDEIQYWDGHKESGTRGICFTSKKDEEINFIQFIASSCGYRATVSNIKNARRVRINNNLTVLGIKDMKINDVRTSDNKSYCFSVPSGLLVLRYNGNIFITGNCNNFMIGLSRMISLLCRAGVSIEAIKDQLDSTGSCPSYTCRSSTKHDTSKGSCCPMAIGNALIEMYEKFNKVYVDKTDGEGEDTEEAEQPKSEIKSTKTVKPVKMNNNPARKCPSCGAEIRNEGGCILCPSCGWSKCD